MRNECMFWALLLSLGGLPGLSQATEALPNTAGINVGELSAVQSETFLYKAQGERAKAIRSIDRDSPQTTPANTPVYQPRPLMSEPIPRSSDAGEPLPVVKMVAGPSRALRAKLLYSGGYEVDAQVGDTDLPGGYKMASVSLDRVVVSRGGKFYALGFSNRAPSVGFSGMTNPLPAGGIQAIPMGQPAPVMLPGQP
jgi:type IV pilus biogenesis protein PilP